MLRRGFNALLGTLALAGSLLAFGAAPAQAANLYTCYTDLDPGRVRACTTITSAPASGVEVYDRSEGRVVRLYNGNSVVLEIWHIDSSGLCGVHGDAFVWTVRWVNGGHHRAVIGDYYLATGSEANWKGFHDGYGPLGDQSRHGEDGRTTCDRFPAG